MAEDESQRIAADVVELLRPILEQKGTEVAEHVEKATADRIDHAVARQLPDAVKKVIKETFDVNADSDEEVRQVKKNLQFLGSFRAGTDKVGGAVIRFFLIGLAGSVFALASYGAYITGWKK